MWLIKDKGKIDAEDCKLTKEVQEENIRELLSKLQPGYMIVFTYRSDRIIRTKQELEELLFISGQ